ncbi:MAG: lipoprotein [Thiohalomonadales bacterium]
MRINAKKILSFLLVILLSGALGSCGQKGALILPDNDKAVEKKKSSSTKR